MEIHIILFELHFVIHCAHNVVISITHVARTGLHIDVCVTVSGDVDVRLIMSTDTEKYFGIQLCW